MANPFDQAYEDNGKGLFPTQFRTPTTAEAAARDQSGATRTGVPLGPRNINIATPGTPQAEVGFRDRNPAVQTQGRILPTEQAYNFSNQLKSDNAAAQTAWQNIKHVS